MSFISAIRNQINSHSDTNTSVSPDDFLDSAAETSQSEVSAAESLIDQSIVFQELVENPETTPSDMDILKIENVAFYTDPENVSKTHTDYSNNREENIDKSTDENNDENTPQSTSSDQLFTLASSDAPNSQGSSLDETNLPTFLENLKSRGFFVPDEEHLRTDNLEKLKLELLSELKKLYIDNKLVPSSLKDLLDSVEETYQHFKKNKHLDINSFYSQCLNILDKKGYTKDLSSNHVDF